MDVEYRDPEPDDLYVHVASDGGIFVAPGSDLRLFAWVTVEELRRRVAAVPATAKLWVSQSGVPSPLMDDPLTIVARGPVPAFVAYPLPATQPEHGINALMAAAHVGDVAVIADLLARGATVNAHSDDGQTALMFAAQAGQSAAVTVLLEGGVEFDAIDDDGTTALMFAAAEGHADAVRLLLDSGADRWLRRPNPGDPSGSSIDALGLALEQGHQEAATALGGDLGVTAAADVPPTSAADQGASGERRHGVDMSGSRRSRPVLLDVLLIGVVVAAALAGWALALQKDDAPKASTPTADVACDLLRPRGMAPSTWFAADGTTTLTRDEAGSIAVTLGGRANFDPQDTDARLVSDVLARVAHRRPGPPLTTDQRAAVARLDRVIRTDCG